MKGKFIINEYSTIDAGEASFLIFKGFDFRLDALNPSKVKIVFSGGEAGEKLPLISKIKEDWWTRDDYRRFLRGYQDLVRSIKTIQQFKQDK